MSSDDVVRSSKAALDPTLLNLKEDETRFFKQLTGIQNDEELRQHIIEVQAKAFEVYRYPCIQVFAFTNQNISRHPAYQHAIQLSKNRPGAILLDVGCCFGNDLRKAVVDGWPVKNVVGADLRPEFWDYGHELFKSTPETFPATFIAGDLLSSVLIESKEPFYSQPSTPRPADLRTLKSLTPLQGHISAIRASGLFHLFNEEKQLVLAKKLATLLAPESGSIIFGSHISRPEKGLRTSSGGSQMFCHSPESWEALWEGQIFKKGNVQVETKLIERNNTLVGGPGVIVHWLVWSITRL